jgi:hypothetical protein
LGVVDDRDCLHIVEEVYGPHLTMDGETGEERHDAHDMVALALGLARRYPIDLWFCDPAEPRSIEKFRRASLPAREGYNKHLLVGVQAVNARIRSGRLNVSRTCANLIKEAGLHRYPTPEETRVLTSENPIDADNHCLSALRYLVCGLDRTAVVRAEGPPRRNWDEPPPEADREPRRGPLSEAERRRQYSQWMDDPGWWGWETIF